MRVAAKEVDGKPVQETNRVARASLNGDPENKRDFVFFMAITLSLVNGLDLINQLNLYAASSLKASKLRFLCHSTALNNPIWGAGAAAL